MAFFRVSNTNVKRLLGIAAAAALIIMNAETSHAAGAADAFPQFGAVSPDGFATMVRLRVPFGGDEHEHSRPTLAFTAGPAWLIKPGTSEFSWRQYTSNFEAGYAFGRGPVLKLGSIDMFGQTGVDLNAGTGSGTPDTILGAASAQAEGSSWCERNLFICVTGGSVALLGGTILLIWAVSSEN